MTAVDLAYINYWHGGLAGDPARSDGCGCSYDFRGLVRMAGEDQRWPDLLVMGEGVHYSHNGGKGLFGAAQAMLEAGGPNYLPLPCTLPRDWGDYAPVMFVNPQKLSVHRFYGTWAPGWSARVRNLLMVRPIGSTQLLHVTTTHGDMGTPEYRLADAQGMRWLADDRLLSAILADWNETLSGPGHEPTDLGNPRLYQYPWKRNHRLRTQPGYPGRPKKPFEMATHAMDYLVGYWDTGYEWVDGIGFVDVCHQAGILTPTNLTRPDGPQGKQLLHILLNGPLSERVVPGTTRVHEPIDPTHPDSDHKRLSVTVEV